MSSLLSAPTTYAEVAWWMILGVGAALFFGTGAALVHYRRTGAFPGQPRGEALDADRTRRHIRGAMARCTLGLVIGAAGLAMLV